MIKVKLNKNNFVIIRNIIGSIKGAEALIANEIGDLIGKSAETKGFKTVNDITDFEIEVSQTQLASLKSGLVELVTKELSAGDLYALLMVAGEFKIRKTVESTIKSKLPTELSDDELDDLVELDAD